MTVNQLAGELFEKYPNELEFDYAWKRCEAEGLSLADVDRRYDELKYAAAEIAQRTVQTFKPKSVVDLTELDSVRMRVKSQAFWVTAAERSKFSGGDFWLVREPTNEHDASAVAVYGRGRKLGYVSSARAAMIAPFLDALPGDAFKVAGAGIGEQGTRMWVDVPKVDALRKFTRTSGAPDSDDSLGTG